MAEFRKMRTKAGFDVESALIGLKADSNGYPIGFLQMGSTLYKVSTSPSNKQGVMEWVKLEKCRNRPNR